MGQQFLFSDLEIRTGKREYMPLLTAVVNRKGVIDVDTVKGCFYGMKKYPDGGCYSECYAYKIASRYGIDFRYAISRRPVYKYFSAVYNSVLKFPASWYRIGTSGDPSHDWDNTLLVCELLAKTKKTPVIITKHWEIMQDRHVEGFAKIGAVFNTSVSALDSDDELTHRQTQFDRIRKAGVRSILRVVTCDFGKTQWGKTREDIQNFLLSGSVVIDTPLRVSAGNARLISGDIKAVICKDSVGGGKLVSLHCHDAYLGACENCKDQCGVKNCKTKNKEEKENGTVGFDF